jgi:glutamate-1-semialdehyde 2,1-aminomutase
MTAGLTTLKILEDGKLIRKLNALGNKVREELKAIFEKNEIDVQITGTSSIFNVHFTKEEVKDANAAFRADRKKLLEYNLELIANGIFFLPTHNGTLSTAHIKRDIEKLFTETEKYAKNAKSKDNRL